MCLAMLQLVQEDTALVLVSKTFVFLLVYSSYVTTSIIAAVIYNVDHYQC